MKRALYEYRITGVKNSIKFLKRIMDVPDFVKGKYNTNFIEQHKKFLMSFPRAPQKNEDIAIIATFMDYLIKLEKVQPQIFTSELSSTWKDFGRKRGTLRL
jgi:acetyl-CoA carboxylase biotin carboxylase subunit